MVEAQDGIGTLEYTLSLENGWNLTSVGEKRDPKVVETMTALASLIPAVAALKATSEPSTPQEIALYRLDWTEKQGWHIGPSVGTVTLPSGKQDSK
jgi:hypothetical protein